jgi:hypothetical protein
VEREIFRVRAAWVTEVPSLISWRSAASSAPSRRPPERVSSRGVLALWWSVHVTISVMAAP